ncbi:hypothetical protein WL01_09905 [Burkholderia ubonensis]|uniref:gp53-like domain-containing protein n=1 Tax=Burkholderia ubonensis TaxID=101571 RepID=UPI0007534999|nr:hypothetical protein [Burkholderia ubonensis]KVC87937.1 hypothetical protein WI76_31685 [Burkholderia ubonensis]KVX22335.1 hypothetical protein WL01_09905 [Burkholderia ubonensis]KWB36947.1 hypothetical protein WL33_16090 [Burkholderia ubonensis]KWC22313.1 hypothetical protein WL50_16645 [Burkholderia ubonensis]
MSNLIEVDRWENGIYQLETSDPVIGGPDGVDNLQAKQLANRTQFLKRLVEGGQSNLDAHANAADPHPQYATKADLAQRLAELVDQSPEALNTLKELANAMGNDPNFATTVMNEIAKKAPIDSPVFAGTTKAPTPPQFDSSTKLATTAFVQTALGNLQSFTMNSGTNATLTQSQAGGGWDIYGACTITLPSTVGLPLGACYSFSVGAAVTFNCVGSDQIYFNDSTATTTSFVPVTGTAFRLVKINANQWLVFSEGRGSVSISANGYQKLPSGLIIQWGSVPNIPAGGSVTVNYPIAFPNGLLSISAIAGATGTASAAINGLMAGASSNPKALFVAWNGSSNLTTQMGAYISLGY